MPQGSIVLPRDVQRLAEEEVNLSVRWIIGGLDSVSVMGKMKSRRPVENEKRQES